MRVCARDGGSTWLRSQPVRTEGVGTQRQTIGVHVGGRVRPCVCAVRGCCVQVDASRQRLVDEHGHERLFHGVNVVSKQAPYLPRTDRFSAEDSLAVSDVADLRAMGFTVVRLLVALPGVMPARGVVNATYLDEVAKIVDALAAEGIYTILDAHQDLYSPRFCGNGFPDWAVEYQNVSAAHRALSFPLPQSLEPYPVDANTGYPARKDCISKPFFRYYFSDAVGKAFQALYDNHDDLQLVFADFWAAVAARFAASSAVLGYEILNEPFLGDILRHPQLLTGGTADRENLAPLYKLVHTAIRKVDDRHIILYEPTVGISQTVISAISATGFSEGPGGPAYNDRQVLSYHSYCPLVASSGQPASKALCDAYYTSYMEQIVKGDLDKLQAAGFLTEWGALVDADALDADEANTIGRLADDLVQSWVYWQFKSFNDPTTQAMQKNGTVREGLYDPESGALLDSKVALLARTYPHSVAGAIRSLSFDTESKAFELVFAASTSALGPTRIYASSRWHYPKGLTVTVDPPSKASFATEGDVVSVTLSPTCAEGDIIIVRIQPLGSSSTLHQGGRGAGRGAGGGGRDGRGGSAATPKEEHNPKAEPLPVHVDASLNRVA